ncbi:tyrosine-type recombinase/integrase [Georgenia yuyongxinii]
MFTYENGDPLKPQYATRLFDKLRMKAGLPKLTFHGQRHSFVSLALASKTDIALVSKMVGHSAVSVTADIYAHLIGSAGRNAANAAASLVPRSAQHNATDSASLDPPDESASASAAGY